MSSVKNANTRSIRLPQKYIWTVSRWLAHNITNINFPICSASLSQLPIVGRIQNAPRHSIIYQSIEVLISRYCITRTSVTVTKSSRIEILQISIAAETATCWSIGSMTDSKLCSPSHAVKGTVAEGGGWSTPVYVRQKPEWANCEVAHVFGICIGAVLVAVIVVVIVIRLRLLSTSPTAEISFCRFLNHHCAQTLHCIE